MTLDPSGRRPDPPRAAGGSPRPGADELRFALTAGGPLLADGATGTQLQRWAPDPGACLEALTLDRPDAVIRLHRRYLDAGARLLTTNTFGGMRLRLALHGEQGRGRALNRRAAELARSVAGSEAWVMGDVGPCGGILAPLGDVSREDARGAFLEQIEALLEGGVDAILVETMTALEEMAVAVEAARGAGAPLVFASFAFDHMKKGLPRTMMGVAPTEAAVAAASAGADVVGCNCGTSLTGDDCEGIVRALRDATDLPVLASPNAGQPELLPSGVVYHESPDSMAGTVARLVEAGAAVVGGCCGTTPEHIARFREVLAAR